MSDSIITEHRFRRAATTETLQDFPRVARNTPRCRTDRDVLTWLQSCCERAGQHCAIKPAATNMCQVPSEKTSTPRSKSSSQTEHVRYERLLRKKYSQKTAPRDFF